MEELLLHQRSLVDDTLSQLVENAPLEDLLTHFQSTVLDIELQEPSFWQLQVVDFIWNVINTRVRNYLHDAVNGAAFPVEEQQNPTQILAQVKSQVLDSRELKEALLSLQTEVEKQINRLTDIFTEGEQKNDWKFRDLEDEHFLSQFWVKVQQLSEKREKKLELDKERKEQREFESCSFDRLSFVDDFSSFSFLDNLPALIKRMQSTSIIERASSLNELTQIPIIDIIHSGSFFAAACSAIIGLFLPIDTCGEGNETARRAKMVVYDLVNQIEDAVQFLEIYWMILDFIGSRCETGELFLHRVDVFDGSNVRSMAVLDCFRVLQLLFHRILHFWIYFTAETLAQILHSTFRLLAFSSKDERDHVASPRLTISMMLFLIDDQHMRWYKMWLLNAPNLRQVFVAIDESGFIAAILQMLSQLRPLIHMKPTISVADAAEKRIFQCALLILSYTLEYKDGQELVRKWQQMPAYESIKQRGLVWTKVAIEPVAAENDALYRTVKPTASNEEACDGLQAGSEHLGVDAIDTLALSVLLVVASTRNHLHEGNNNGVYDNRWAQCIGDSVAIYLHTLRLDVILAELSKVIDACWAYEASKISTTAERENPISLFPFQQSKSTTEVGRFLVDNILGSGILSIKEVQASGQWILHTILSSEALTRLSDNDTLRMIFRRCKCFVHLWNNERRRQTADISGETFSTHLFSLITDVIALPTAFDAANKSGLVDELLESIKLLSARDRTLKNVELMDKIITALHRSVSGVYNVQDTRILPAYSHRTYIQSHKLRGTFCNLLGILSLPTSAKALFGLNDVQETVFQVLANIQETDGFTEALHSRDEESSSQLRDIMGSLQLLRCCLSTEFAATSLLSLAHSPLVDFIAKTLIGHRSGDCMRSSNAEDICCVAFQLALSLASSVSALLDCSALFEKFKLLNLSSPSTIHRYSLYDGSESLGLGPCSFLEKQLRYEFEIIGGPCERLPQYELFAFDDQLLCNWMHKSPPEIEVCGSFVAITLGNDLLQAIKDNVVDFELISQLSWKFINEVETQVDIFGISNSAAIITEMFAKILYELVMSHQSRFEPTVDSIGQEEPACYPTDLEQKIMSRFYLNYADGLSLPASPALLNSVVKTFGRAAIDCYPVTMLMILFPTYEQVDIVRFLSRYMSSPWAGFLWSRSIVTSDANGTDVLSTKMIAQGVEIIIGREFPQILRILDQCQCSLLTLVLRWHRQHFWNYFDWQNIVIYTYLIILNGAEFQVYIIVAILKHLEPTLRQLTVTHSTQSLAPFLTLIREPIRDFSFNSWQSLLRRLETKYHDEIATLLSLK